MMTVRGIVGGMMLAVAVAAPGNALTISIWDLPGGSVSWRIDLAAGSHASADTTGWEVQGTLPDNLPQVRRLWAFSDDSAKLDACLQAHAPWDPRANGGALMVKPEQEFTVTYAGDATQCAFLAPVFSRSPRLAGQLRAAFRRGNFGPSIPCTPVPDAVSAFTLLALGLTGLGALKRRMV
jgi:hypothetical protein